MYLKIKIMQISIFYILRLGEHLLLSLDANDCVKISELHQLYLDWCQKNDVDVPVVKEVLGKVIKKLFGTLKSKSMMKQGDSAYYYTNLIFVDDDFRENKLPSRVKLPPHVSIEVEHEMVLLYFPTTFVVNTDIQEYKVYISLETCQYHITFRDDELNLPALGIGEYSTFDQMFVGSMTRICDALVICHGKAIDLPPGNKVSTNLVQLFIGTYGIDGKTHNVTTSYYLTHCLRVLPLNGELKNRTCAQCVHDINQRIRQLAATGCITEEQKKLLLKRVKLPSTQNVSSDSTDKDTSLDKSNDEPPKKKFKFQKVKKQPEVKSQLAEKEDSELENDEDAADSGIEKENDSEEEEIVLKGGGTAKGGAARNLTVSLILFTNSLE